MTRTGLPMPPQEPDFQPFVMIRLPPPGCMERCPSRRLASFAVVLALVSLFAIPASSAAQVGTTTDILTGTVTDPAGHPIEGADIEAMSLETEISRHAHTNDKGRYTIVFPDGGGQYRLTVRFIGMAPSVQPVARQADEDRLVSNVQMSATATRLATVTVQARRNNGRGNRRTPGSTERDISSEMAARLPIDASDLNALATLAPGVVGIDGTDSTDAAFSVAGLRPTANSVTLDGLSFGSGSVPQDAVRSTQVVTSTYDVARGEFSGGLVASTTRGGTNVPEGSFTYTLRDQSMAWGAGDSSLSAAYTQNQLGGGFGGPIVKDKLFVFGAVQGRWRDNSLPSLLNVNPAVLQRLGVNGDSLSRFLSLVGGAGVRPDLPNIPPERDADNTLGLLRADWLLSDNQTLMVRGDWRDVTQNPTRVSQFALPQTGGTSDETGGGVMAVLTSYFGGSFINELRTYWSRDHRSADPFMDLPNGRVQVASQLTDSLNGISALAFGGSNGLPQRTNNTSFESTEELSWLPGSGTHRIKAGLYYDRTRYDQDVTTNEFGTYFYSSLAGLADGQPAEFTRTLAPSIRAGTSENAAFYLGDIWRMGRVLQLTYGARVEGAAESGAPAFNPLVDSLFDRRTDHFPSEISVSPRVGFTALFGGGGGFASTIVRGGVGEFRSPTPSGLFAAAQGATGLPGTESQLVCIGDQVPTPDWASFELDPSTIPTQCLGGAGTTFNQSQPNVVVFDPAFTSPRAWRASLGVQRRVFDRIGLNIDANWTRGISQYGFSDLNLDTVPKFRLADEHNRPVYVTPSDIDPSSGVVNSAASRLHPELGDVIQVQSNLHSESGQVTLGVNGFTDNGAVYSISYTFTKARDQSSFSCCSATAGFGSPTTSGNPNQSGWSNSSFQREHAFIGTFTVPINPAIELTSIARMSSGAPFTPLVASDINGDGARNDRAFIFDPAATADTAVANAMRRVLANSSSSVRDCLLSQIGAVAARNSCSGPWQPAFDIQLNIRPNVLGLDRRLTLSIVTTNLISGVDELLHGANGAHGWGAVRLPDPTLLFVRGFDQATSSYVYAVNERFGSTSASASAFRVPFQIGFQGHFALGPDRTRDRLRAAFGGGGRGGHGGGNQPNTGPGTATDFASRLGRGFTNPVTAIITLKDSLHLTPEQVAQLTPIAAQLEAKNDSVQAAIRKKVDNAGSNADPRALLLSIRPRLTDARQARAHALDAVKKVLTQAQWNSLPDQLKSTGRGGAPRQP
ncbi:MAG: carboxypeptidase regulatory-like domain-containing protein [Gemmatimonadaceae bacterium]